MAIIDALQLVREMLAKRDTEKVLVINAAAGSCHSRADFDEILIPKIADCFSLTVTSLSCRTKSMNELPDSTTFYGGDMHIAADFERHYRHLSNPYRHDLHARASGFDAGVLDMQNIFDAAPLRRSSKLYNEFQRPMGMGRSLVLMLSSASGRYVTLGLWRERRAPAFDSKDKIMAQLLTPLLAHAYGQVSNEFSYNDSDWLMAALEMTNANKDAIILLNSAGDVSFLNDSAQNIFPKCREGVSARACISEGAILKLLDRNGEDTPSSISATTYNDKPVSLRRIPKSLGGGHIIHVSSSRCNSQIPEIFAVNGVTPRETAVAELAAHGLSNKEVARELNITHFTVQDHLKAIYRKLQISNRVQLTNLLIERQN